MTSVVENLENQYEIPVGHLRTRKGSAMAYDSVEEFRANVAVPYLDVLLDNIESRFSDDVVKLLVSSSVFNPALLPRDEALLAEYGTTEIESLAQFYGSEAEVIYDGVTHKSPSLVDKKKGDCRIAHLQEGIVARN